MREVVGFPVHCDIPVRFRDLDGLAHVNNAVYFTYLEIARWDYWAALGVSDPRGALEDWTFLLARAECDFRAPIHLGATVRVWVRCPRIGTRSWDFEYRLEDRDTGQLHAEARTVQVYVDRATGASTPLPPDVRAAIERLEGRGSRPGGARHQ